MAAIIETFQSEHLNTTRLVYAAQPIVDLSTDCRSIVVVGFELLYRGIGHPPDQELLERLGEISLGHYPIHINMDTLTILEQPEGMVAKAAEMNNIVIEWLENPFFGGSKGDTLRNAGKRLERWRDRYGISIAIDDFGSGLDGIGRLATLDRGADIVKISGPLFNRAIEHKPTRELLSSFGSAIHKDTKRVVEWIEESDSLDVAKMIGGYGQGWLFPGEMRIAL